MKSKLIHLSNYACLLTQPLQEEIPVSELSGDVELELKNLCLQSKKCQPAETVSVGDAVTLTLVSDCKKFNRSGLQLCVGSNFFSKELEQALIEKSVGQRFSAEAEGATVQVTVEQCLHTVIPDLSDALILEQNIPGVESVAQYKTYILEKYKKMYQEYYTEYVAMEYLDQWFAECAWELDADEVERWCSAVAAWQQAEMDFHNMVYLENTPGELEEENRSLALRLLQSALVDCLFSGVDSITYEPDLKSIPGLDAVCKRVMQPLQKFLSGHFRIVWKEEA